VSPVTIEDEQKPLALHIEYRCLDEGGEPYPTLLCLRRDLTRVHSPTEIEETLESAFVDALSGSSFDGLSRLLVPTLLSWVRRRSTHELEMIGLLGEINLGSFKDLGWGEALDGLPSGLREKVERWLTNWHEVRCVVWAVRVASLMIGDRKIL
jgi:hypothetical protein